MAIEIKHGSGASEIAGAFVGGQAIAQQQLQQQAEGQLRQADIASQARQQQSDLQRGNIEFEISAKQQADFNRLSDSYEEAVSSGNYSEEELQQLKRDIDAKQMGIEPRPRMKKASPWPEGQDVGQTWIDEKTGMVATRDSKGELNLKPNPRMISAQDISKWAESIPKKYDADSNEIPATPEEIRAHVQLQAQLWREINGIAGGSPAMAGGDMAAAATGWATAGSTGQPKGGSALGALGTTAAAIAKAAPAVSDFVGAGFKGLTGKLDPTEIETRKKYIIANDDKMTRQQVLDAWAGNQINKKNKTVSEGTNFKAYPSTGTKFSDPGIEHEKSYDWGADLKNLGEFTDISTIPKRVRDVALDTPVVGDVLPVVEDMGSNSKKAIDWLRGKSPQEKKKLIKEKKAELRDNMLKSKSEEERKKIALEIQALEKLEE